MARRRYQRGSLSLRGDRWIGRWREDVIENGVVRRVNRKEVIGSRADFPTKRLAQRELETRLSVVNSPTYRARPSATFREFAERWQVTVLSQHKPSTQAAIRSQLRKSLSFFNDYALRDIQPSLLQSFIAASTGSPKTVRNGIATMRMIWNSARAWGYVTGDPFDGLVLPKARPANVRVFNENEARRIIEAADEPYKTLFWLAAETGMRAGEIAGLRWEDIESNIRLVRVRQSVWSGKAQTPKTTSASRVCAISERLANRLAELYREREGSSPVRLVFETRRGTPIDPALVVKRKLHRICDRLGIERGGFHAFRHFNASAMDRFGVPMKVRQERLGHSDPRLTLRVYTHTASEDDKKIAAQLASVLRPDVSTEESGAALSA